MKVINILTIIIVLILQSSAVCQDKICIDREVAIKVASKLDSFDRLKLLEKNYLNYIDTCTRLTEKQASIIKDQAFLIQGNSDKIDLLNEKSDDYKSVIKVIELNLDYEKNKSKKLKKDLTISLIGGGVVTLGLTTAFLIVLL
tara:strand:- start:58098 stop:58526 length:429 start_codon:yes stop_codon:yes gene_type:complete